MEGLRAEIAGEIARRATMCESRRHVARLSENVQEHLGDAAVGDMLFDDHQMPRATQVGEELGGDRFCADRQFD